VNKGTRSVGNRRDYPRELWGWRDFEMERFEQAAAEGPLPHAPARTPGDLRFSLCEPPILGGVRSKAIDEAIAKHVGVRPKRRAR
jgi:hypothetical protein